MRLLLRPSWPALIVSALLAACTPPQPPPPVVAAPPVVPAPPAQRTLQAVDFTALDGWQTDDLAAALPALKTSCDKIVEMSPTQPIGRDGLGGLAGDWLGPCGALRAIPEDDGAAIRAYFVQWFQPYRVGDGAKTQGLFTGYYEPELKGARKPDARFRYPLLSPPPNLPHGRQLSDPPYYTRAEIEAGALKGQAAPLVWIDDAVDLHILQIQGSGRVVLGDGTVLHVHYAGDNGWPFVGIGKVLIERGKLPPGGGNMVAARNWLKAHPDEAPGLMAANPRYVFFRFEKAGPIGAEGVVLTSGRSLAVDPRYIPLGAPVWLQSADGTGHPLQRLFVAQDTGSAITGVVRGDVYWGSGEAAFQQAGLMRSTGSYFLLLPRTRGAPLVALPSAAMVG